MSATDDLAERLYAAYVEWDYEQTGAVHPKWFALREELRRPFVHLAATVPGLAARFR